MFTGLIETTGTFAGLTKRSAAAARLALNVPEGFGPVKTGDSIAVNGVCLTVVEAGPTEIEMDVLDETLARTNLSGLVRGERVNLELALTPSSRLGGHLVTGHVDDTGTVLRRQRSGADWVFEIGVDAKWMPFIAPKGSIAVDGVSLTVVETGASSFGVHIIPYTFEHTTLGDRADGARVNVEVDIMARYIANFIQRTGSAPSGLTREFLAEHGFA